MEVDNTQIFDTLPDSIRIIGKDKKIIWANKLFEDLVGIDKEELNGSKCYDYLCLGKTLGDKDCYLDKVLNDEVLPQREITIKESKDKSITFLVTHTPYRNEKEEVIGIVEYLRDITSLVNTRTALEEQLMRSKIILGKTVNALVSAIESRDPYTAGHQRKVSQLVRQVAQAVKPEDRHWVEGMRVTAQLHDIGKICIPAEILANPTTLKKEEFELIKLHSAVGYGILNNVDFGFGFSIADAILQHHERLNGGGYPAGLTGDDILLEAKILAVADVVEAMTNRRPYREGLGLPAALDEIESNASEKYDKDIVDICRDLFMKEKFKFQETAAASI
ncbi:MAG: HD domain-containing protein [Spirochaetota bacterium]|nr:MAG: HD domain-containing protein [Spirochaetota bacterium]